MGAFLSTPDTAPAPVRAIMEYFSPSSRKRPSSPRSMEAPPVKITRTEEVMDDEEDSDEDREEIEDHQVDEEVYDKEEEDVDSGDESEGQESEGEKEKAPEESPIAEEEPIIVEKQDESNVEAPVAQEKGVDAPATDAPVAEAPADEAPVEAAVETPASNGATEEITPKKTENNNLEALANGHENGVNGSSSATSADNDSAPIEIAQSISV